MGFFRFRRSVKLLPGVRWNIGKRSSSVSFGVKGAHYTFGTAGSRTTVGIPGTGLSYTDIHSTHRRVAQKHEGIPMPSQEWIDSHQVSVSLHIPGKKTDEPPILPEQIDRIHTLQPSMDVDQVRALGEYQADELLRQVAEQQREVSKTLLKQFYAQNGHGVSDAFIDHCYDHPGEPWKEPYRWGCFSILVAAIAIYLFIMAMWGIIQQKLK